MRGVQVMDDTTKALIAEARSARGGNFYGPISDDPNVLDLIARLADALEAAHQAPTVTDDPREHWVNNPLISPENKVAMFEQALRAAQQAPEGDDREALVTMLNREYGIGNGTQWWVEFQGTAEYLADCVLAALSRRGTPATVEQIADVREVAEQIVERTKGQIGTHSLECHAYHLPCFAHFVLNRISPESQTGDDR